MWRGNPSTHIAGILSIHSSENKLVNANVGTDNDRKMNNTLCGFDPRTALFASS